MHASRLLAGSYLHACVRVFRPPLHTCAGDRRTRTAVGDAFSVLKTLTIMWCSRLLIYLFLRFKLISFLLLGKIGRRAHLS